MEEAFIMREWMCVLYLVIYGCENIGINRYFFCQDVNKRLCCLCNYVTSAFAKCGVRQIYPLKFIRSQRVSCHADLIRQLNKCMQLQTDCTPNTGRDYIMQPGELKRPVSYPSGGTIYLLQKYREKYNKKAVNIIFMYRYRFIQMFKV